MRSSPGNRTCKSRRKKAIPLFLESRQAKVPPPEGEGCHVSQSADTGAISFGEQKRASKTQSGNEREAKKEQKSQEVVAIASHA
jgi:hypothetical protein